jgi:hypothetical protein
MMMLMALYTAQWETKIRDKEQRLVEAEQARLARRLWSATESSQPKRRYRPETSALKRLVSTLGYTAK